MPAVAAAALAVPYAAAQTPDPTREVLIQARDVSLDEAGRVVWEGDVELTLEDRRLRADRIVYDDESGEIFAEGDVSLSEPDGDVVFAERVRLTDDFEEGEIDALRARLGENGRLAAVRAEREDGAVTRLKRGVYSTCPVCAEDPTPLWQFRAREVVHDEDERTITYRDAVLDIGGVPVLWTPYMSHPDPSVKRLTGFLTPGIGSNTDLGEFVEVPYYIVLAQNMDLTLSPIVTTEQNAVLGTEFRHITHSGYYELDGSVTYADQQETEDPASTRQALRGHIFGEGRFRLSERWRWGFDVEAASDDTYLRRYDISNDDRLASRLFLEGIEDRDYTNVAAYYFQSLRAEDRQDETPVVPLHLRRRIVGETEVLGGRTGFNFDALVLQRADGADIRRFSGEATWDRAWIAPMGLVAEVFGRLRGDLYYTSDVLDEEFANSAVISRVLPTVGTDLRWPFVRHGERVTQVVEPIAQLIYSPEGGNPENLPNEDSTAFEFDDTNLFAVDRLPGLDRFEGGARANLGLRYAAIVPGLGRAEALVGQTFRLTEETVFAPGSGLRDETSDYVGRLDLQFDDYIDLSYRFRIADEDFSIRRTEVVGLIGDPDRYLQFGYVNLQEQPDVIGEGLREELRAEAGARFSGNWSARGFARHDIDAGRVIAAGGALRYLDDCFDFELQLEREYFRDREIEPSTSVIARIKLDGLG